MKLLKHRKKINGQNQIKPFIETLINSLLKIYI